MLGLALLTLVVGISWYGIHRSGLKLGEKTREGGPSVHQLYASTDPADHAEAKRLYTAYDRVMEKVLMNHPELRPKWQSVPPSENGFLQWLDLLDSHGKDVPHVGYASIEMPDDICKMISGSDTWDSLTVQEFLLSKKELMNEIRRIGLLKRQSAAGVGAYRFQFVTISFAKAAMDLLCADARVAADKGDGPRALESLQATLGIARHHTSIEVPSLTHEAVGVLGQLTVYATAFNEVIPQLNLNADELRHWRKELKPVTNKSFATVLRGDFYTGMRGFVIPLMDYDPEKVGGREVVDLEDMYDEMAIATKWAMQRCEWCSPMGFWRGNHELWRYKTSRDLSPKGLECFDVYQGVAYSVYANGLIRAQALYRCYDAAFAIAAGDVPPVDLLTERAFKFDPKTRVLSFPDETLNKEIMTSDNIVVP